MKYLNSVELIILKHHGHSLISIGFACKNDYASGLGNTFIHTGICTGIRLPVHTYTLKINK